MTFERAGILSVGREVLIGRITDTNATFLSRELTRRGVQMIRRVTVDDDPREIQEGLRFLLRAVHLVVVSGGLGPTDDDLTLEAVSRTLGCSLQEAPEVRAHLQKRLADLRGEEVLQDPAYARAIRKMSLLPEGAMWFPNPVGAAPGVFLPHGEGGVLLLPGVPEEMEALFETFTRRFAERFPRKVSVEEVFESPLPYEALLAPHLEALRRAFPDVYVKSHVRPGQRPRIAIQVFAESEEAARARIQEVWDALRSRVNAS